MKKIIYEKVKEKERKEEIKKLEELITLHERGKSSDLLINQYRKRLDELRN